MMSHVFSRNLTGRVPLAVGGEGCYIIDGDGKRYLDGSGGAAVSCLGHGDRRIADAVATQMEKISFAHTGFFTSEPAEELAALLTRHAPGDLDHVYFVSGGSEAVEAAIKLARQYFIEIGQPKRHMLISRRQSYHGSTLGALAAGGNMWRRRTYDPMLIETSHISPCYAYRGQLESESLNDYGLRVADELESEIQRLGPETVMAFIAEPVVGATLGAVPAIDGYFKRIKEICGRHGVLLIFDEVMCGMGRTGHFFACDYEATAPDILVIAKGLGAGYQPVGAMMCSSGIYDAIKNGSGFFQHGHTYLGHPVACAAALEVAKIVSGDGLLGEVQKKGASLLQRLDECFGNHPFIGDVRGRGLFIGLEFVSDRLTKKPFEPDRAIHKAFKEAAFDAGLICYPMGGTVDGHRGDHVLLAPPFIINQSECDELVEKLVATANVVFGQ